MSEVPEDRYSQSHHEQMVARLGEMFRDEQIEIVKHEYFEKSFGLWILSVVRGDQLFRVSWDAFEGLLEISIGPRDENTSPFARMRLKGGLQAQTLTTVHDFVVQQTARVLNHEEIPPIHRPLGTGSYWWPSAALACLFIGFATCFEHGVRGWMAGVAAHQTEPVLGLAIFIAGVILSTIVAVGFSRLP